MSREENKKTEEKVYTVGGIIREILNEQGYSEKENRGLTEQNISRFLIDFFKEIGLDDAVDVLKGGGKDYAFTEQEKPIIKCLIMERNRKLRRNKLGEHKEQIETPDFEFLFKIVNNIMGMLERRGYDPEKLHDAMERYMTDFLKNEASISVIISEKLQKLIESNVSNSNTHLRTFDKFIWMRAMETELNAVINKWENIFNEYNDLLGDMISEKIEEMYFEPCEVKEGNKTSKITKKKLYEECIKKYFEEWGKAQLELLYEEREKLLSEREKIVEKYNEKIQFYRTKVDRRSKNKRLCLEEIMQVGDETMEIDDKLKKLDKKQDRIYTKCQDLAYDEIYGKDEENPIVMPDTREILQKAKENVEYDIRHDNVEEEYGLITEVSKNCEAKKALETE